MSGQRESGEEIVVVSREYGLPYSKGLMAQSIMATGLSPGRSYELAKEVELALRERREGEITVGELRELAEHVLEREIGSEAVVRFRQWNRLGSLERPLIVLLGGATGSGKSTLATLIAHRLGVTRVSATDMIRQVLRAFFTYEFMPTVHFSSFEAGAAAGLPAAETEDPDLRGFLRQAENVATGVRAIVDRAVLERTPIVLEGVHLLPGLLSPETMRSAVVVEALVTVSDEELHRSHFHLRTGEAQQARGPADRYLEHFQTIRKLQSYLVERAQEHGVRVIDNHSLDASVQELMALVLDAVATVGATTPDGSLQRVR